MLAHIARYRSKTTGRVTRAGLRDKVIGRHVFIDKMVITSTAKKALLKFLHAHVGMLAANWLPAAEKTGAPAPGWVKRHAPHGSAHLSAPSAADFDFEAVSVVTYGSRAGDLRGRIASAVKIRIATLKRRIPFVIAARAKKAGFH